MDELLDYYLKMEKDEKWFNSFFSSSKEENGSLYPKLFNTNFRKLTSYASQFKKIQPDLYVPRELWKKNKGNQESSKHRIVKLTELGLIKNSASGFMLSNLGLCFKDILEEANCHDNFLNEEIIWIFIYVIIYNKTIENIPNYVSIRSKNILFKLKYLYVDIDPILSRLKDFYENSKNKKSDILEQDLFYILNFIEDRAFLKLFDSCDTSFFKSYVKTKFNQKDENNLLYKKFKSSSVRNFGNFLDEVLFLIISLSIEKDNIKNIYDLILKYCGFVGLNAQEILSLYYKNKTILDLNF